VSAESVDVMERNAIYSRGVYLSAPHGMTRGLLSVITFVFFVPVASAQQTAAPAAAASEKLKLLISVNTQTVVAPLPIRVTLHVHNFSNQSVWLYRPVRDAGEAGNELNAPQGGSTLVTRLSPVNLPANAVVDEGALGSVMRPTGMPHPRLVEVNAGGDFEETLAIRVKPAFLRGPSGSSGNLPYWGSYRLSVIYGAGYSNGADLRRDLGIAPWQGVVSSNAIEINLAAPAASNNGTVDGTVVDTHSAFVGDALVSLSGEKGHLLSQLVTNSSGRFSFSHLPFGTYWVSVWQLGSTQAGGMYEHATLSAARPEASLKLLYESDDTDDAKKMLHKPVIFRVTDSSGQPVDDVLLDDTWSNGPVMQDLKARTNANGMAVMDVIPGSNYLSIKAKGCKEQDVRSEVSDDVGVGGFNLTYDCGRK
jgi:Carboxypeptidase regulatory-like domain